MNIKYYRAKRNEKVAAYRWWQAARNARYIPYALIPLISGRTPWVEISSVDLQWCKSLPFWDGIDGWPLLLQRVR